MQRTLSRKQRLLIWFGLVGTVAVTAMVATTTSMLFLSDDLRSHGELLESTTSPSGAWVYRLYYSDLGGAASAPNYTVEVAPVPPGSEARVVYQGPYRAYTVWHGPTTLSIGGREFDVRDVEADALEPSTGFDRTWSLLMVLLPSLLVAAAGGLLVWHAWRGMVYLAPQRLERGEISG